MKKIIIFILVACPFLLFSQNKSIIIEHLGYNGNTNSFVFKKIIVLTKKKKKKANLDIMFWRSSITDYNKIDSLLKTKAVEYIKKENTVNKDTLKYGCIRISSIKKNKKIYQFIIYSHKNSLDYFKELMNCFAEESDLWNLFYLLSKELGGEV